MCSFHSKQSFDDYSRVTKTSLTEKVVNGFSFNLLTEMQYESEYTKVFIEEINFNEFKEKKVTNYEQN